MADPRGPTDPIEPTGQADPTNGHDEAALAVAARHALHDEELVAAFADGDVEPDEAARARGLIERCVACRELHADIVTLATAHRATAAMTARVPRDVRLSREQAASLRPDLQLRPERAARQPGLLERLRAALAVFGRPIGGTLVAAGLVGVLLGSFSLGGLPFAGAGSMGQRADEGAKATHAVANGPLAPAATARDTAEPMIRPTDAARPNLGLAVVAGSIGLIVLGVVLLVRARPRGSEPG